jgi:hypothetical protein
MADKITIVPFGDVHYGSPACDFTAFASMLTWAKKEKNLYLIAMGDLFDSILADDKRYDARNPSPPFLKCYEQIKKMIEPVKDKMIGMHTGNHELTLSKKGYGDPVEQICTELNIPYLGYSAFTKLHTTREFKKGSEHNSVVIYSHHGFFAGRKMGSKANNLTDLAMHWDADIYLVAHSHDLFGVRRVKVDYNGARKLVFCQTGTFLKTAEWNTTTYSERAGFPPTKTGIARIEWQPWKQKRVSTGKEKGDLHIIE